MTRVSPKNSSVDPTSSRSNSIRRPWRSSASPRWSPSEAPARRSAALADAAVDAGATADEIVEVLVGVARVVGLPCVVAAAPNVAIALGYDVDEDLEQ